MHISSVSCLHVQHWCFVDTFKFFANFYRSTCNTHGLPDSLTCNAILGYLCTAQSKIGLAPSQLPLRRIHSSAPSTTQGVRDRKQAALALKLGDIYHVSHSHESFESYHFHCTERTNEKRKENREIRWSLQKLCRIAERCLTGARSKRDTKHFQLYVSTASHMAGHSCLCTHTEERCNTSRAGPT